MNKKNIEDYINEQIDRDLPIFQKIHIPFFNNLMYSKIKDSFYDMFEILIKENTELKNRIVNIESKIEGLNKFEENIRNLNEENKYLKIKSEELDRLGENVRNINEENKYLKTKAEELDRLGENVRNINEENKYLKSKAKEVDFINNSIKKINTDIEYLKFKIKNTDKYSILKNNIGDISNNLKDTNNINLIPEEKYEAIDYFDFENHFRGSIEDIKKRQEIYIKYFKNKNNVVDLGCGRGEFLQLLKDNNINAIGVDIYRMYVDYCSSTGIKAVYDDALNYIRKIEKTDGVFAGQIVEHLSIDEIVKLSDSVFDKLEDDCYFIVETPNPMSLAIYTNSFYLDPSHVKPVHPYTMKYILEKSGFRNVNIVFTENSRDCYKIPEIKCNNIEGLDEFNKVMNVVSNRLFGSQDYAVIAQK